MIAVPQRLLTFRGHKVSIFVARMYVSYSCPPSAMLIRTRFEILSNGSINLLKAYPNTTGTSTSC